MVKDRFVETFVDLHQAVQEQGDKVVIYRGVKDASYELVPKVGRYQKFAPLSDEQMEREEKTLLRLFKERAWSVIPDSKTSDWEFLALAQHHGLPTRLLDWSRNPLVAAFFAVDEEHESDSVIYAFHHSTFIKTDVAADPFKRKSIGKFVPNHITPRITAQAGVFTVHPVPREPLRSKDIQRWIIPSSSRGALKHVLAKYGVHSAVLFPDLDGLARHLAWRRTSERGVT